MTHTRELHYISIMYQPLDESFYQAIEDWACEKYINMIQQTCYPYEKTFKMLVLFVRTKL